MPKVNYCYVIVWPDGVVKVGETWHEKRWRKFVARGGELIALFASDTHQALLLESHIFEFISTLGPAAFPTRYDAILHLGSQGGGYSECRRLDSSSVHVLRACLREIDSAQAVLHA